MLSALLSCGFPIGALWSLNSLLVVEFPSGCILLSVFILEGYGSSSDAFSAFIEMIVGFLFIY